MRIQMKTSSGPLHDHGRGGRLIFKGNVSKFGPAIIKVEFALNRKGLVRRSHYLKAELIALKQLQGLAVPNCIKTPPSAFSANIPFQSIAVSYVNWPSVKKHKLKTWQAIGLWLFIVEQLCAFRRRRILYTDIKIDHILMTKSLSKALIIDFDRIVLLNSKNDYSIGDFGRSLGEMAPETLLQLRGQESALVYSLGLLACSLIVKGTSNQDILGTQKKIEKKLAKKNLGFYELIKNCIDLKPSRRPQNYPEVLKKAKKVVSEQRAIEFWKKLREPHLSHLENK